MDELSVSEVAAVRHRVLDGPQHFRQDWLAIAGKVVMPFESSRHLTAPEADRLARALLAEGKNQVYGLTTQPTGDVLLSEARLVQSDPPDLLRWDREFALVDALLVPEDAALGVLFTVDEYGLAAGPVEFVETFLGASVEEADRTFRAYAADMAEAARQLPLVVDRYLDRPSRMWARR